MPLRLLVLKELGAKIPAKGKLMSICIRMEA
jgi:hypothetical protein